MAVIDVRDADFAGGHIRGAVNVGEGPCPPTMLVCLSATCRCFARPSLPPHPLIVRLPALPSVAETFEDDVLVDRVVSRFCR